MKHLILALTALLCFSVLASAQVNYRGHAYGSFGFESPKGGSIGDIMTGGFGGDYIVWKGVGFGGDAHYAFRGASRPTELASRRFTAPITS